MQSPRRGFHGRGVRCLTASGATFPCGARCCGFQPEFPAEAVSRVERGVSVSEPGFETLDVGRSSGTLRFPWALPAVAVPQVERRAAVSGLAFATLGVSMWSGALRLPWRLRAVRDGGCGTWLSLAGFAFHNVGRARETLRNVGRFQDGDGKSDRIEQENCSPNSGRASIPIRTARNACGVPPTPFQNVYRFSGRRIIFPAIKGPRRRGMRSPALWAKRVAFGAPA